MQNSANKSGQKLSNESPEADNKKAIRYNRSFLGLFTANRDAEEDKQKSDSNNITVEPTEWDTTTIGEQELRNDILQINDEFKVLGMKTPMRKMSGDSITDQKSEEEK